MQLNFYQAQPKSDLVWCSGNVHRFVRQFRMSIRFTKAAGTQAAGLRFPN